VLKKIILITSVFLMLAIPASSNADINFTVEVVVPIGTYTNSSVNLSANQTTFINASEANTTLELFSSQNASGTINVILTSTPLDIPSLSVPSLDKYLKIEATESITNNLTSVLIRLYYTDEEVSASGIEEGFLSFYWWNQSSSVWEKLTPAMEWVYGAGVDTIENYVWANVTHFSDYCVGGFRMPPTIEINREMPSIVKTNKKFKVELYLNNQADFELFNLSIKEKIPEGYRLRKEQRIIPEPEYIGDENGSIAIYWRINKLASHTNLSLEYSLSAPKSTGNYTFKADAFGFDASGNKYAAVNIKKQEVKRPPLWESMKFWG
jgi:hypothetical protein